MKQKKSIIIGGVVFLFVVVGFWGWWSTREFDRQIPGNGRFLSINLEVTAPLSGSTTTINNNGSFEYEEGDQKGGRGVSAEAGAISNGRLHELVELIKQYDFFSMTDRPATADSPLDGSSYVIEVKTGPESSQTEQGSKSHQVSCYEFNCPEGFTLIKEHIDQSFDTEEPPV